MGLLLWTCLNFFYLLFRESEKFPICFFLFYYFEMMDTSITWSLFRVALFWLVICIKTYVHYLTQQAPFFFFFYCCSKNITCGCSFNFLKVIVALSFFNHIKTICVNINFLSCVWKLTNIMNSLRCTFSLLCSVIKKLSPVCLWCLTLYRPKSLHFKLFDFNCIDCILQYLYVAD